MRRGRVRLKRKRAKTRRCLFLLRLCFCRVSAANVKRNPLPDLLSNSRFFFRDSHQLLFLQNIKFSQCRNKQRKRKQNASQGASRHW